MRAQTKILTLLLGLLALLVPMAFADVPENDTVNITIYINTAPNVTWVDLEDYAPHNGPANDIDLVAAANKTVYCIINASDYDGYLNLNHSTLNVSIFHTDNSGSEDPKYYYLLNWSETPANNRCWNQSTYGGALYDGGVQYNCSISMPYYAENGTWTCNAKIKDASTPTPLSSNRSNTATLHELIALNVSAVNDIINFGYLAVGENISDSSMNVSIENIGNVPLSINVSGIWNYSNPGDDQYAMKCNVSYINETDLYFDNDQTFNADFSGWTSLSAGTMTPATSMSLAEASSATRVFYTMFWGLNLINTASLSPQPQGKCNGWLFFDALRG
jgi:hypothetical protein